jgi:hypothetical protein
VTTFAGERLRRFHASLEAAPKPQEAGVWATS